MSVELELEAVAENADTYEVFRAFENPKENGTTESRALQLLDRLPKPAIVRDEEGRTLLHLACLNGWHEVVTALIHTYFCSPTRNSTRYGTPLHQACAGGNLNIVKYLILDENCYSQRKSGDGTTPLHYACSCGRIDVVKFLINEQHCKVNCRRNGGATPLHEACAGGHLEIAQYILNKGSVRDRQCTDDAGATPLHYACSYGHIDTVKYLIQEHHCSVNCKKEDGATPLHEACASGQLDVVKYLRKKNCDPKSCVDSGGWTPVHYACHNCGHLDVVKYLIDESNCDPKRTSNNGSTPLHNACEGGNIEIAKFLIQKGCNPTRSRNGGITPLHEACSGGHLDIAEFLISEKDCDPDTVDNNGMTPLHYACSNGHIAVVKYLVKDQHCIAQHRSKDGVTPLQRACASGHLDIVQFFVDKRSYSIKDNLWYLPSPMQIAYDNNHIDIVAYFMVKQTQKSRAFISRLLRRKEPPIKELEKELLHRPFFKLFVVGEAEVGKSTLVKALEHKLSDTGQFNNLTGRFKTVTGVTSHTAGIIPVYIERPNQDHVILYDLAGQPEYYSSHAALLESLVSSPETLVLIVVKMTEEEESMVDTLQYWSSIITSLCQREREQKNLPSVMIVGSHADSVENAQQKLSNVCDQVKNDIVENAPQIVLNCTRLRSRGLSQISGKVAQQCSRFHKRVQIDIQVNFVYSMIKKYLNDRVAYQFSRIAEVNGSSMNTKLRENGLLPSDNDILCEHLMTLSKHGRLLFLRNEDDVNNSWVILKVDILLSEVNGTIFAPDYFKQYHDISNSTGVVPYSKIRDTFLDHDPRMIMDFLTHFEFCHSISEPESLQIVSVTRRMSLASDDLLYFFPALVTVDRPDQSCCSIERTHYKSGWCLECQGNDILSSQFLHVLLIRLAFSEELSSPSSTESNQTNPVIQRKCNIWKSGIHWVNMDGVDTILEVIEKSKAVVLMIGCMEGSEVACVKQRSYIIREIFKVKSRFAGAVKTIEYFIDQENLMTYPLPSLEDLSKIPIANLSAAVSNDKEFITHQKGMQSPQIVKISTLLHFEPYACLSHKNIVKLLDETTANEEVSDAYLSDIACDLHPQLPVLKKMLDYNVREFAAKCEEDQSSVNDPMLCCFLLLKTWKYGRDSDDSTFHKLQSHLDDYSVFCGRNPLDCSTDW